MHIVDLLRDRGFIYQTTHEQELMDHLATPRRFYVGFDPTADSLHVGSLVPIMAMLHMQQAGHMPFALVGGGTARVGDPSGKSEMRRMLSEADIADNESGIAAQLARYLKLDGKAGHAINNKDWLLGINYIDFLRDFGTHFSINRMLTAESVKLRLETGLSFLEFNYMLLQAYDFYYLADQRQITVQMGGQDQWGNIVAGIDLIRRKEVPQQGFGITFPLITNSSGTKFGKTEAGTIWLDADRTTPFDYYQFWRNCEDADVARYLGLFTLLPMDEVRSLSDPAGNINRAKEILAYEATAITHGPAEAAKCFATAANKFGQADPKSTVQTSSAIVNVRIENLVDMPSVALDSAELAEMTWTKLLVKAELAKSNSEARRLIKGRGGRHGDQVIENGDTPVTLDHFEDGKLILRAGKKRFKQIVLQ